MAEFRKEYREIRTLGAGGYGEVFRGKGKGTVRKGKGKGTVRKA